MAKTANTSLIAPNTAISTTVSRQYWVSILEATKSSLQKHTKARPVRMSLKPPLTDLDIPVVRQGFYKGFNSIVTLGSKLLIALLVIWAAVFSEQAGQVLGAVKNWSFANFGAWYLYVVALFILVCFLVAVIPSTGKIRLGKHDDRPEFSNFSWFSMMFGAGIGIGMLTFATAEPIYHFAQNPSTIMGLTQPETAENVRAAYKWSFLHWGLPAWSAYAIVGLSLAFFSYNRGLPLTIRSALAPLFGRSLEGRLGDIVDITAVIATITGVAVTIGFGLSQFASGMHSVFGSEWMLNAEGGPSNVAMLVALAIVMSASTLSALSGVGNGIKWLSNINMALSIALLAYFIFFGSAGFAIKHLVLGIWDHITSIISTTTTYWGPSDEEPAATLYKWQSLWWTVFYWAWWIAFAPFVGVFLARISRGRTVREFILGAVMVPSLMCFIWFTIVGGTAIDLELTGGANRVILDAGQESQLFAMINFLIESDLLATLMIAMIVVLLLTYLVTSADSAVLIITTISSAGDESQKGKTHIILWGILLTGVIGFLLVAGGLDAIKSAMIIGALPFSLIMVLMGVSLVKALIRDSIRAKQ